MRTLPSKKQSGVVLVISLVMLLLLTLIGLTGMQTTTLEEKMAGNSKDRNIAFQAAESTLAVAEAFILANASPTTTTSLACLNTVPAVDSCYFNNTAWLNSNSAVTPTGFGNNFNLPEDPRYIIKKISGTAPPVFVITVRAVGSQPGTEVILQEYFTK